MIEVCVTILVYNQGMINWVEKSGSQPPGKATSTVSTMLQSMCEVLRINLNGISGYDFFPSRLPWPLCPWQLPFLRLLDFQSVKSFRPDASGDELGKKSLLVAVQQLHPNHLRDTTPYYLLLFYSVPSLPSASA